MVDELWAQLADAISAIRSELERAEIDGQEASLKFRTGPVELEFTVDVEGKGRAKVFVLPVSADATVSRERTHRIKLTLQPVDEHGRDKKIADQTPQRPS